MSVFYEDSAGRVGAHGCFAGVFHASVQRERAGRPLRIHIPVAYYRTHGYPALTDDEMRSWLKALQKMGFAFAVEESDRPRTYDGVPGLSAIVCVIDRSKHQPQNMLTMTLIRYGWKTTFSGRVRNFLRLCDLDGEGTFPQYTPLELWNVYNMIAGYCHGHDEALASGAGAAVIKPYTQEMWDEMMSITDPSEYDEDEDGIQTSDMIFTEPSCHTLIARLNGNPATAKVADSYSLADFEALRERVLAHSTSEEHVRRLRAGSLYDCETGRIYLPPAPVPKPDAILAAYRAVQESLIPVVVVKMTDQQYQNHLGALYGEECECPECLRRADTDDETPDKIGYSCTRDRHMVCRTKGCTCECHSSH